MPHKQKGSLMEQYVTPEVIARLTGITTASGFTIEQAIRSGIENPDSSIGMYAGDAESYEMFAMAFNPIIEQYHGYGVGRVHKQNFNVNDLQVEDLNSSGKSILSTRIRVGRNLAGYPFAPAISRDARLKVEKKIVDALSTLTGDMKGTYHPLSGMDKVTQEQLIADHFLFKEGDRFLASAGANRDWPEGRGIFHSADKHFLVWVNEEDQLRIISMQEGGDVRAVFDRLARAIACLEKKLEFAYSNHLGYLSSCPTNLGTAMRASFHIKLPTMSQHPNFKQMCTDMKLSVRGIHGEHSESDGGIYDISNKQRLGLSEVEAVQIFYNGAKMLLEMEHHAAFV